MTNKKIIQGKDIISKNEFLQLNFNAAEEMSADSKLQDDHFKIDEDLEKKLLLSCHPSVYLKAIK
jgi:hypothetical protein